MAHLLGSYLAWGEALCCGCCSDWGALCSTALLKCNVGEPHPVEGPPHNPILKASALRSPHIFLPTGVLPVGSSEGRGRTGLRIMFPEQSRRFSILVACATVQDEQEF